MIPRLFTLLLVATVANGQPNAPETSTVFEPGAVRFAGATQDSTYATTRIPALVCTKRGTLLAFCEARVQSVSDWADMDLLMRRSTDGGRTWAVPTILALRRPKQPTSNVTPIVDADGQTIHLLYQRNYNRCYYVRSTDDGRTWTEPLDITATFDAFRPQYNWKVLAPGPGHAIQLSKGKHRGRLVVPVWLCEPNPNIPGGDHRPSCVATIYSDDRGRTWQRGAIVANNGDTVGGQPIINPSENVLVETSDGRVLMNIRSESAAHRRAVAFSPDGATRWTKPVFDEALFEPVCMASLLRIPARNGRTALLFVNPDSRHDTTYLNPAVGFRKRANLSAKLSYDDGRTWPVNKVLDAGQAGYSDLAVGPDGTLYCLYETNAGAAEGWRYHVVLKRFSPAWLTTPN